MTSPGARFPAREKKRHSALKKRKMAMEETEKKVDSFFSFSFLLERVEERRRAGSTLYSAETFEKETKTKTRTRTRTRGWLFQEQKVEDGRGEVREKEKRRGVHMCQRKGERLLAEKNTRLHRIPDGIRPRDVDPACEGGKEGRKEETNEGKNTQAGRQPDGRTSERASE